MNERKEHAPYTATINTQPKEWNRATKTVFTTHMREAAQLPREKQHQFMLEQQRKRWEILTGVAPEDSSFTIIVPIHNEEKALTSSIGALLSSDIPSTVHATVLFITNGCTDSSGQVVDQQLRNIGNTRTIDILDDSGNITPNSLMAQRDNTTYLHIDTVKPGKANAMTIGNEIARMKGDKIAMVIDADSYVEPLAIPHLFAKAHELFVKNPGSHTVLSGNYHWVMKDSWITPIFRYAYKSDNVSHSLQGVCGAIAAWDTDWIASIGGIPPVSVEDYALGVYSRQNGFPLTNTHEAKAWGYKGNTLKEMLHIRSRSVRGRLQMIDQNPKIREIIEQDSTYMRPIAQRVEAIIDRIKRNPKSFPAFLGYFIMWELARIQARIEHQKNPNNQSWSKIQSAR